jgi:glycosyltransferase involved in cell wall biosynthesis
VEAQACGTPVLAFGRGGARETVIDGSTGLHFHAQTPDAIQDVVMRFEALETPLDPNVIRRHARHFSTERFQREFSAFVRGHWARHAAEGAPRPERSRETYDHAA